MSKTEILSGLFYQSSSLNKRSGEELLPITGLAYVSKIVRNV